MAFLQLALPGLRQLAGYTHVGLPRCSARLAETVCGQIDWTQFVHGRLAYDADGTVFYPLKQKSRLQMMANTDGIITIPEGQDEIPAGREVQVQLLSTYPHSSEEIAS